MKLGCLKLGCSHEVDVSNVPNAANMYYIDVLVELVAPKKHYEDMSRTTCQYHIVPLVPSTSQPHTYYLYYLYYCTVGPFARSRITSARKRSQTETPKRSLTGQVPPNQVSPPNPRAGNPGLRSMSGAETGGRGPPGRKAQHASIGQWIQ